MATVPKLLSLARYEYGYDMQWLFRNPLEATNSGLVSEVHRTISDVKDSRVRPPVN